MGKVKEETKLNYVNEIKDLKYKRILLDDFHKNKLEYDIQFYEQTGVVRSFLKYIHDVSLAEVLYNTFGITEWDHKSISLEDVEKAVLFKILSNILNGDELSEKDIKFFGLVKLPYPDFVKKYYEKYIEDALEHGRQIFTNKDFPYPDFVKKHYEMYIEEALEYDRQIFTNKDFPFKLYISSDGFIKFFDNYIKGKPLPRNQNYSISDFKLPLNHFAGILLSKAYLLSTKRIIYILRYADANIQRDLGYVGGDIDYKIDIYNRPIREMLKLCLGTKSGGHIHALPDVAKDLNLSHPQILNNQSEDYFEQLLRRSEENILSLHNVDRETNDSDNKDEFKITKDVKLPKSKADMFDNNLNLAYQYYEKQISEKEKDIITAFASKMETPRIKASKIRKLIIAYLYMTQDPDKLGIIINHRNCRNFSQSDITQLIDSFSEYKESLEAPKKTYN